jgi:hypothetical protein
MIERSKKDLAKVQMEGFQQIRQKLWVLLIEL